MQFTKILVFLGLFLAVTMSVSLNSANFNSELQATADVWLIEYYSPMCGSCKEFSPVFDKLAAHFEGKGVRIGKVNIDEKDGMNLANQQNALEEGIPAVHMVSAKNPGQKEVLMAGDLKSFNQLKTLIEKTIKKLNPNAEL